MIATRVYITLSLFTVLCITTRTKLSKAQYNQHHGAYDMANHYSEGSGHASYGGGRYGGYGSDAQASEEVDERPKVQLGIRLKIPAIKFELPRVNLPKITVSAKIRQPDGPRVISLPEINLDTSSKVAPPGAQGVSSSSSSSMGHQNGYYMSQNSDYAAQKQPYYANESDDSQQRPNRPNYPYRFNQYRGSHYNQPSYSSTTNQPTYWTQNQFQNYNNNKVKGEPNSYNNQNMINDANLGFDSPVYVVPTAQQSQQKLQYSSMNGQLKPTTNYHQQSNAGGYRNLLVESGGRFKRNHSNVKKGKK